MSEEFVNKIFNTKWEETMPLLPPNFIDIVISSPPYNVDLGNNKFRKADRGYDEYKDDKSYKDYLEWMDKCFKECYRVLKSGGRACFNIGDGCNGHETQHADFTVNMKRIGFIPITTIVWDKSQVGNRCSWGSYQSPSQPSFPKPQEYIVIMAKETLHHEGDNNKITVGAKEFQRNSLALWRFPPETRMMILYDHPAVFPEELPKRLIQQLTYEDDIVLDPFSGSGTTCVVAKKLKRKYIGIEMSKKYYNTSLRRLGETPEISKVKTKDGEEVSVPDWIT